VSWIALAAVAAALGTPADPAAGNDTNLVSPVVVTGRRGVAAYPAERELAADQIDALGATDIAEVIQRTSDTLGASSGPIVIVNGKRVADPKVFYSFPPDALERVEVLPQAANSLYGATPDRRVINIVLQRRFASKDLQLAGEAPTAGGTDVLSGDLRRGVIADQNTSQAGLRVSRQSSLTAGERPDVDPSLPRDPSITLRPDSAALLANLSLSRPLGDWSASLSTTSHLERATQVATVQAAAVSMRRELTSLDATGGLSGQVQEWAVQLGLDGQFSRLTQEGYSPSNSSNALIAARAEASRRLFDLPAGAMVLSLSSRLEASQATTRIAQLHTDTTSTEREVVGGLMVPLSQLTPDASGFAKTLGQVVLSLGGQLRDGGSGGGRGLDAAVAWSPSYKIHVDGTWSSATQPVSDQVRFAPAIFGAPTLVYDFRTGQASEVLPLRGGNPALTAPKVTQIGLTANAGPYGPWQITAGTVFRYQSAENSIGTLPLPTPEVEAAFPERFVRDGAGRLISIDQRPINLEVAETETLSSNFAFTAPLDGPPDQPNAGLIRVTLTHVWRLRDEVTIRKGLPNMNRLAGDGGGMASHEVTMSLDGRRGAVGFNATARWNSAYRIRAVSGQDGPDDLKVAALGFLDLRMSYRFDRALTGTSTTPTRRGIGSELEIGIINLFDSRPRAELGDGRSAPGYGHDDQDPLGRTLRISLRHRF
jgi:hypothetical protein